MNINIKRSTQNLMCDHFKVKNDKVRCKHYNAVYKFTIMLLLFDMIVFWSSIASEACARFAFTLCALQTVALLFMSNS